MVLRQRVGDADRRPAGSGSPSTDVTGSRTGKRSTMAGRDEGRGHGLGQAGAGERLTDEVAHDRAAKGGTGASACRAVTDGTSS